MYKHIRPIHLIGALSPADVDCLIIRLVEVEGRRGPFVGRAFPRPPAVAEMLLEEISVSCSPWEGAGDSLLPYDCPAFEIKATGKVAGGGELNGRFQVELHFVEGHTRSVSDSGSLEVIKELVWPPVHQMLHQTAHMLTSGAEMQMAPPPRPGLLERMRWWVARRELESIR